MLFFCVLRTTAKTHCLNPERGKKNGCNTGQEEIKRKNKRVRKLISLTSPRKNLAVPRFLSHAHNGIDADRFVIGTKKVSNFIHSSKKN